MNCTAFFPPPGHPGENLRGAFLRRKAYKYPEEAYEELEAAGRVQKRELADGSVIHQIEKDFAIVDPIFTRDGDGETIDTVEFTASDGSIDRYGDIIDPAGWVLENYLNNPVMLADHRYTVSSIVGQAVACKIVGCKPKGLSTPPDDGDEPSERAASPKKRKGKLRIKARIDPPGSGEQTDLVRAKLAAGSLRTVSVGFRALEWERLEDEEGRWVGFLFVKQELLENSFVAVPANPQALIGNSLEPPAGDAVDSAAEILRTLRVAKLRSSLSAR